MTDENLVPKTDGKLDDVSGGKENEQKPQRADKLCCPRCGSTNVFIDSYNLMYTCADCGCRGF